jgi:F-type H+-transporting ATPase subunit a
MGHGVTWFSFLPFYQELQHYADTHSGMPACTGEACPLFTYRGVLFGNPATFQHVFAGILVLLVLVVVSLRARSQLKAAGAGAVIPDPKPSVRNFIEVGLEALYSQAKTIMGKEAPRYFPIVATLGLFILFSNLLGLFPGFTPPTDNWNTTMACSGFVFLWYNFHGLRVNGWDHLKHIANPAGDKVGWFLSPLLLPVELVSHCARPFTLGVRLAANMVGDHAVLTAFLGLVPVLVPLPFLALGLLVCLVQTLVFVLLSMIYIGMAVAESHHDEHEHDATAAAAAAH